MKKKDTRAVAFVPLRLNSERVPGKNLRALGGKPLLWHVFDALTKVEELSAVYAYCSDDSIVPHLPPGVRFLERDPALDGNTVKGLQICRAFCAEVEAEVYALAHATSPFLEAGTMSKGLSAVFSGEHDSALSVIRHQTFAWWRGRPLNYDPKDVPRTQDMEPVFVETSAFYVFAREVLVEEGRRVGRNPFLVEVDSLEAVDIDTEEDFRWAERLMAASG